MDLIDKLESSSSIFRGKKVIIAYSGGKDSTLVLLLALKYAEKVKPIFFDGPIFPKHEKELVIKVCEALKLDYEIITMDPLEDEDFKKNPENRCYICKSLIMKNLQILKKSLNFDIIAEGTNISELGGHRPGYQALQELDISSPLLEIKVTKDEIRQSIQLISQDLQKWYGTSIETEKLQRLIELIHNSASSPCLCSRIEYNLPITVDKLEMISKAENWIRNEFNLKILRVRLHSNKLARIEVSKDKIPLLISPENSKMIVDYLNNLGFTYVTIDLKGFRSGSLIEK